MKEVYDGIKKLITITENCEQLKYLPIELLIE